jgi:salicylate hydroxylase
VGGPGSERGSEQPILIAGGGIGGLALALALAQRGVASIVLERQPEFAAAGAGIQIGPNGVRVLQELGLAGALAPLVGAPEAIAVFTGASGRQLARLPLGAWIAARHGAPYWVAHRADLHGILLGAARAEPRIVVRTGFEVARVNETATGVTVDSITDGTDGGAAVTGAALIGADGLWSTVRRSVAAAPSTGPAFAGATATRTVIPASKAGRLAVPHVGLWLGPAAHVVHYPVRGGSEIAVVTIAREAWQGREWDADADGAAVAARLARSHAAIADTLGRIARQVAWHKWALHRLPPLAAWVRGRVALLGDAAHPVLPYLAQGGALALEDAVVLARCLAEFPRDIPGALARYQSLRLARTHRVQAASLTQGRIYRLPSPLSWGRDAALGLITGERLMARLDWLYAWRPPGAEG